jgi:hypothetical protein
MPLYPPLVTSSGQVVVSRSGLPFCNELVATIAYIPISVTNSATIATSTLFQQYITVDLSGASQYINPNLSNLSIVDSAFATLASWRESGATNTGTASWWVLIPSGIPASSEIGLAVMINTSGGTVVDGVTTGISPVVAEQIGLPYATDDNGGSLFDIYDNFSGTLLNTSLWTSTIESGNSLSISNGIEFITNKASGNVGYIQSKNTIPVTDIIEIDITNGNVTAGEPTLLPVGLSETTTLEKGTTGPFALEDGYNLLGGGNGGGYALYYNTTSTIYGPVATSARTTPGILGLAFPASGSEFTFYNDALDLSETNTSVPTGTAFYIYMGVGSGGGGAGNWSGQWVRVRVLPPGGVMPSVTVSPLTIYYATLTNF